MTSEEAAAVVRILFSNVHRPLLRTPISCLRWCLAAALLAAEAEVERSRIVREEDRLVEAPA
jgi:hypothetical protein